MAIDSRLRAIEWVALERARAEIKHGPLKPGPERWMRLIAEECAEVMVELESMRFTLTPPQERGIEDSTAARAVSELAQLAQLCIGVIELIQQGRIKGEQ